MATTAASSTLLTAVAARDTNRPTPLVQAGSVLLLATLTAAAAQVSVPLPFSQVPFTFQPMVVLLGGLALGSRLGASAQVLYLLAGIAGMPVFAASATLPQGALRLLGPTGGYLLAYPAAAYLVGRLAERGFDRRYLTSVVAMLVGLLVVYAGGTAGLTLFANAATASSMGWKTAVLTGVVPFVAADVVKLALAAAVVPSLWSLVGHHSTRG